MAEWAFGAQARLAPGFSEEVEAGGLVGGEISVAGNLTDHIEFPLFSYITPLTLPWSHRQQTTFERA